MIKIPNFFIKITAACVLLVGCATSLTSALVVIKPSYMTKEIEDSLMESLKEKANALDAHCSLANESKPKRRCYTQGENPSILIVFGYAPSGNFVMSAKSTRTHFIPPTDEDVKSGKFVTQRFRDLEDWMRNLVPQDQILETHKSYVD